MRHYFWSKIIVATAFIGCSIAVAVEVRSIDSESKNSQCERFHANMAGFNERFTSSENDRDTERELVQNLITIFTSEIEFLETQKFSDDLIQMLHQEALNSITVTRDNMVDYLDAKERGDLKKAEKAYGNMQLMPYQISDVIERYEQYCGKL